MDDKLLDIGFKRPGQWFRLRAAAILIEEGCVLLAHNPRDPYYYSVGGGIHHNETAEDAVRREVLEETGADYEIDRLAVIHESFFPGRDAMTGLACHEVCFYFLMQPKGSRAHVRPSGLSAGTGGVPETMHWLPIEHLAESPHFPTWLGDWLASPGTGVRHIVTRE